MLPFSWPSLNEVGLNGKGHEGRKYRAFREKCAGALRKHAKAIPRAEVFRRALFVRYYGAGCRSYDDANLRSGAKGLVDAMVKLGYLVDDSPKWFQGGYAQSPEEKGRKGILVRIQQLADG